MRSSSTVEELLAEVDSIPAGRDSFELWVPSRLTLRNEAVMADLAMGFLLDRIVGKGFYPSGIEEGDGGRLHHYSTELCA